MAHYETEYPIPFPAFRRGHAWCRACSSAAVDIGPLSPDAAIVQTSEALAAVMGDTTKAASDLEAVKAERLSHVIIAAPKSSVPKAEVKPERDPTLISVPSNTLGAGEPLWIRSDRQAAQARLESTRRDR